MKKIFQLFLFITTINCLVIVQTGFNSTNTTQKNMVSSLAGAYQMKIKEGNTTITAVKIVTDFYYTVAYYDLEGKKFVGTEGGTYSVDKGYLIENIEFSSLDSTLVGTTVSLKSSKEGEKWELSGTKQGKKLNQTWNKIQEESSNSPLRGAWRITQRLDPSSGAMSAMQQGPRKTIKMMSGTRFQWIAYNTATKQFSNTGGGTYTAKDGKYTETIEFFPRDPSRVGMQLTFNYEVKGKDWHHTGKSTTGNPVNEVWSNVDLNQ